MGRIRPQKAGNILMINGYIGEMNEIRAKLRIFFEWEELHSETQVKTI